MKTNSRAKLTVKFFKILIAIEKKICNLYLKGLIALAYKPFIKTED